MAFVPQFVEIAAGYVAVQFMVLGVVSVVLSTLADILAAFSDHHSFGRFGKPQGAAMIALGIGLALAKRPTS